MKKMRMTKVRKRRNMKRAMMRRRVRSRKMLGSGVSVADVRLCHKQETKLIKSTDRGSIIYCEILFRTNSVGWCRKHSLLIQCVSRNVHRSAS